MAFPTTGTLDNFNRADSPSIGAAWSQWWGDADPAIASNQMYADGAWHGRYWNAGTFGPDSEVFLTNVTPSTMYLFIRGSVPASPCGYMLWIQSGYGEIHRVDSGVKTLLGSNFVLPFTAGYKDGLEAIGSTLKCYQDDGGGWDEIASRSDGTYASAGYLAFDTVAAGIWEDFGGGAVVVAGGARLDARWLNFWQRGQTWFHFWQDAGGVWSAYETGSQTVTAALGVTYALAGSLAGTEVISAGLGVLRDVSASWAGSESVSAALNELRGLASTGGGSTTAANAAILILRGLAAGVGGGTAAAALLSMSRTIEAAIGGSETGVGGLAIQRALQAAAAGSESIVAAAGVARGLEAWLDGALTIDAGLALNRAIQSTENGLTAIQAALTVTSEGGGIVDLDAALYGASQIVAALTVIGEALPPPPSPSRQQTVQIYEDPGSYARLMEENKRRALELWVELFRGVLHLSEEDARIRAEAQVDFERQEIEEEELVMLL